MAWETEKEEPFSSNYADARQLQEQVKGSFLK